MAQLIAARSPSFPVLNLAGRTTIKQLAAVLTQTDITISNDSGPMHLAAELGVPTLGLFTCTSPHRSGPPGDRHEFVSTQVACAASYRKVCLCPGDAKLACFRELDVARAWAGLSRLVERHGFANPIRRTA
jgi:heptosyltransferase-1